MWDKAGLGHNGQWLGGGHEVAFVDGSTTIIPARKWPAFLEKQKALMAARTENAKKGLPVLTAMVRLPSGEVVDQYDASFTLCETWKTADGEGAGSCTRWGGPLGPSVLRWYQLHDGTITFDLSFGKWSSKPVTVEVIDGVASPSSIVFEME